MVHSSRIDSISIIYEQFVMSQNQLEGFRPIVFDMQIGEEDDMELGFAQLCKFSDASFWNDGKDVGCD